MNEPTAPHSNPVSQQRRSGCLRSCFIVSLVLLILVVVGGVVVYFAGRTYIVRQLPVWEERYPALGLALDLLELGGDISPDESSPAGDVLQIGSERQAGVNDKHAMPEDIPLYPDPVVETYSVGEDQAVGFQRVARPPAEVLSYLRETIPQQGWDLSHEQETASGYVLVWRKGERTCQIEVVADEGASEIWLRHKG